MHYYYFRTNLKSIFSLFFSLISYQIETDVQCYLTCTYALDDQSRRNTSISAVSPSPLRYRLSATPKIDEIPFFMARKELIFDSEQQATR